MRKIIFLMALSMALTACKKEEQKPTAKAEADGPGLTETTPVPTPDPAQAKALQAEPASTCEDEDCALVERMRAALRNDDRQALSQMFNYPLRVRVPVPTLKNGDDFLKHYDDIFDEYLIALLRDTPYENWEELGWRGKMIGDGLVWINAGKITTLHHCGPACQKDPGVAHNLDNPGLIAVLYPLEEERMHMLYYLYATPEREYLLMAFKEGYGAEETENSIYLTSTEAPKEAAMGGLSYVFEAEESQYTLTVLPEGGQLSVRIGGKKVENIALEHQSEPLSPPEL